MDFTCTAVRGQFDNFKRVAKFTKGLLLIETDNDEENSCEKGIMWPQILLCNKSWKGAYCEKVKLVCK